MPAFEKRGNDMDSYYSLNQVGGKIVIWSRQYNINGDVYRVVHGGVYDPENNLWSPISSIGSPVMSGVDIVLSSDDELFFWGYGNEGAGVGGGIFNPSASSAYAWRNITSESAGEQIYYIYGKVPE